MREFTTYREQERKRLARDYKKSETVREWVVGSVMLLLCLAAGFLLLAATHGSAGMHSL